MIKEDRSFDQTRKISFETNIIVAESSTVAVAKLVINPAKIPANINGTTIFLRITYLVAERTSADSSR